MSAHLPNHKKLTLLVFTDLDGTLLDHDNYSFKAAQPALNTLEQHAAPLIPVTSKTCSELLVLRSQLNNQHPFVVENGAAIYFPLNYFSHSINGVELAAENETNQQALLVYSLGRPRLFWSELLNSIGGALHDSFISFEELGVTGIVEETGLAPQAALQANQRQASEPVKWLGSAEQLKAFTQYIESQGGQVLRGGRFLHILDATVSKGRALRWLTQQYQLSTPEQAFKSIALGDADNDLSMLAAANQAVLIRSNHHALPDTTSIPSAIISQQFGPEGWNEVITSIIIRDLPPLTRSGE